MALYNIRKELLPLARDIILEFGAVSTHDEKSLKAIRNRLTKKAQTVLPRNLELIAAYRQLIEEGKMQRSQNVLRLIQKRKVRTLSGIANITVLTKDLGCPGECIFCPTETGMPKSYLSNEPAMMRAIRNEFNAYKQVKTRLNGLVAQGHDITKIDIRTAGGTWGAVPEWYRQRFLKGIFLALNEGAGEFTPDKTVERIIKESDLQDLIKENETARCRCVGLWVETRPDWVDEEEIRKLRECGVTGVELGIQTTDDSVNAFNKRGHGLAESIRGTELCRDAGLKVCHHLMPNLPTATVESDLKSGIDLFDLEGLRPDYLKIYPTMVTPYSALEKMLKKDPGIHSAYNDEILMSLLAKIKGNVPEYCRIIRVIRDIPAESVVMGSKTSNLRQIMQRSGVVCRCVRCREIQDRIFDPQNVELRVKKYNANNAEELFISFDDALQDKLIGICRLRLPNKPNNAIFAELKNAALVRELHVYGKQESLEKTGTSGKTQHLGYGRKLLQKAEAISKESGYNRIAVISAIGTREYYKKLGYKLIGNYMIKDFN